MSDLLAPVTAERALLGSLLYDRDAIASVAERITPEAFIDRRHRKLFEAILDCWHRRCPPDPVTVQAALRQAGVTAEEIPLSTLTGLVLELLDTVGTGAHAPYYADLVVDYARSRALSELGRKITEQAALTPGADPAELVQEALQALPKYGASSGPGPRSYAEMAEEFRVVVTKRYLGEGEGETRTGFRLLDHLLRGGFRPGELTLLGARPSMGKTSLAMQLAHNAARDRKTVLIFSAEMSMESLMYRAAAEISHIPPRVIDDATASGHQLDNFLRATRLMEQMPVYVDDTSGITTAQMIVRTQRQQAYGPVGLVIFDYIELAGDAVKGDSEERRISSISRNLKHLARVCNVPVLALCQLNRQVESRSDPRPRLSDLRYSGSLEQDADVVLFLFREDYYVQQGHLSERTLAPDAAEVIIAKQRNGPTGPVHIRFDAETMTFSDFADPILAQAS